MKISQLREKRPSQKVEFSDKFKRWFGDSKVVDEQGNPLVVYHGTSADIKSFRGMVWASTNTELPAEYAYMSDMNRNQNAHPNIIPLYMRIVRPFNADLGLSKTVTINEFMDAVLEQATDQGFDLTPAITKYAQKLLYLIRRSAYREESGPHYDRHDFWLEPWMYFGRDGTKAIKKMFDICGYDGVKMLEGGEVTYGVFNPNQVKSIYNNGNYDSGSPNISENSPERATRSKTVR